MKMSHAMTVAQGVGGMFGNRWIHSAAIRLADGKVYAGVRHYPVIMKLVKESIPTKDAVEGYILNTGEFIDKEKAVPLAAENGQLAQDYSFIKSLEASDLWDAFNVSFHRGHCGHGHGMGMFH